MDYLFGKTKGEAQRHLLPRMEDSAPDPWESVNEMLDHPDSCFQNYYEAEEAENAFYTLTMHSGEDFNTFHTEFSRLASVGRIPPSSWRGHLWRKLNKEFRSRLLATSQLHPTYQDLVKECQRLAMELKEYHRSYPANQKPTRTARNPLSARTPGPFGSLHRTPPGALGDRSTPRPERQPSRTPRSSRGQSCHRPQRKHRKATVLTAVNLATSQRSARSQRSMKSANSPLEKVRTTSKRRLKRSPRPLQKEVEDQLTEN